MIHTQTHESAPDASAGVVPTGHGKSRTASRVVIRRLMAQSGPRQRKVAAGLCAWVLAAAAVCGTSLHVAGCAKSNQGTSNQGIVSGTDTTSVSSGSVLPAAKASKNGLTPVVSTKAAEIPAEALKLSVQPWSHEGADGKVIATPNYKVFTTSNKSFITDNMPAFLEAAFGHYTTSLGTLPPSGSTMEVYLLDTRSQWEAMTRRFMGEQADTYLRIQKGGFTSEGRAILYDIGRRDTFAITAHEAWHVYTQRTFKNPLPVWLEEGIACYMEGFRWDTNNADKPRFLPWANFERFDQLRWGVRGERLMTLEQLTRSTPQQLIAQDPNAALFYYAQVWALVHFLNESEDGKYRAQLQTLLKDAAAGQILPRIRREIGDRAASIYAYRKRGVDILALYFGKSAEEMQPEFKAFLDKIVLTGTRQQIWQGYSPLNPPAVMPAGTSTPGRNGDGERGGRGRGEMR